MRLLLLIAALLLPASALAQAVAYGTVVVLKDRKAGFLEDVQRASGEVTVVRSGQEAPLRPGDVLQVGDAVRTAAGTCVIETPAGWRIEIAERSQLRLAPTVIQRLGEVFYRVTGAFSVRVDEVELLVEGTGFKVSRDMPGAGNLAVTEGRVRAKTPGNEELSEGGQTLDFDQAAAQAARPMTVEELSALDAWRAARFEPSVAGGTRRHRVHVRLSGGLNRLDEFTWGQVGLEGRFRAVGPLWLNVGAAMAARPVDELAAWETAFAMPVHAGLRLLADLPGAGFIGGGADFTLQVGENCIDGAGCVREIDVQPGVLLNVAGGLLLGRFLGVDAEFGGGVTRRRFPAIGEGQEAVVQPDPHFRFTAGIFVRL